MKRKKKKHNREVQEPYQLLTTKAKIVNLSDQDALLLGIAGYAATKMWNVANHERKSIWQETGKIPGFPEQCKTLEYKLPSETVLGKVQQVKISYEYKTGNWYLLIYHKVKVEYLPLQNIMALDLGIINIVTGYITNGNSFVIPGGELLALDRYFHKMKAKTTSSKSRKCRSLNRKWGRQRNHFLHVLTKSIVEQAVANNVSHIIVGELKGIRSNKDWGKKQNQELHAWPYRKIIQILRYKAALRGIWVEEVSERNTSTTCPVCEKRVKSARIERGLFVHCGIALNADAVGAFNILQRYLRDNGLPLLEVVGALARPVVNLFVWRKATPKGREQGTFKVA